MSFTLSTLRPRLQGLIPNRSAVPVPIQNLHLYYRIRQSHGDHRLVHEAPGPLFLEYEAEDLASFLQLSMLNGWGGYVLTHANYANAFFSHDEYLDFYSDNQNVLAEGPEGVRH